MAIRSITHTDSQTLAVKSVSTTLTHQDLIDELNTSIENEISNPSIASSNENIYHLVLRFTLDGEEQYVEFDQVDDVDVSATSEITQHPLVNGDTMSDHMIRKPTSLSFGGTFSLAGNQRTSFPGSGGRLVNIETFFERLKNEGVFLHVVKMSGTTSGTARFLARDNMVITSIKWTEHQNSLSFNFELNEVITVDVDEMEVDESDDLLPNIYDPTPLSSSLEVIDMGDVTLSVIQLLLDKNMAEDKIINYYGEWAEYNLKSEHSDAIEKLCAYLEAFVVVDIAAVVIMIGAYVCAALVSTGFGLVAAVGILIAGVVLCVYNWLKKIFNNINYKKKWNIDKFKYSKKDNNANDSTCVRLTEFLSKIYAYYEIALDEYLTIYSINYDEDQRMLITLDSNYYVFTFTKNNTSGKYSLNVTDIDGNDVANMSTVVGLESIGDCSSNNYFIKTNSGMYLYLLYIRDESKEEDDLTQYYILTSKIKMDDFNQMLLEMVEEAMES